MPISRLSQLEKHLELLREQLGGLEEAMITSHQSQKVLHKQQIRQLRKEMQPFEQEYWEILAQRAGEIDIPESEAEVIIAEIVEQHDRIGQMQSYPQPVVELLQKIYEEVSKPGTPAAAKLKGSLSLMPPFVNVVYEAELDTENTLSRVFARVSPTFNNLIKRFAKKL